MIYSTKYDTVSIIRKQELSKLSNHFTCIFHNTIYVVILTIYINECRTMRQMETFGNKKDSMTIITYYM